MNSQELSESRSSNKIKKKCNCGNIFERKINAKSLSCGYCKQFQIVKNKVVVFNDLKL
jgi:hypothetical protein